MTILVTGGAGYIGSHIVLGLVDSGFKVVVVDNLSTGFSKLLDKRAVFEKGDIGDQKNMLRIVDQYNPKGVIHLAAFSRVAESVANPEKYHQNNVVASLNLLDVLQQRNISNFVFSSSAAVFGNVDAKQIPIDENCPKNPISPYGQSKLVIEKALIKMAQENSDFRFVTLRYFNACGADIALRSGECHDPETHIIPLLAKTAIGTINGFQIFGDDFDTVDGTCIRDYIHVSDLSQIHINALQYLLAAGQSDDFNCGYGYGYSVKEIVSAVQDYAKKELNITTVGRRQGDPDILVANNKKLMDKLGFKPRFNDLETIVKTAYDWEVLTAKK